MSAKLIGVIYLYLVSAASLALLVTGIFHGVTLFVNLTQYDQYPTRYGTDTCDQGKYPIPAGYSAPMAPPTLPNATPSPQEIEDSKRICQIQVEKDRHDHKVQDIKDTLTFTLIGALLFGIHFPLARKHSNKD